MEAINSAGPRPLDATSARPYANPLTGEPLIALREDVDGTLLEVLEYFRGQHLPKGTRAYTEDDRDKVDQWYAARRSKLALETQEQLNAIEREKEAKAKDAELLLWTSWVEGKTLPRREMESRRVFLVVHDSPSRDFTLKIRLHLSETDKASAIFVATQRALDDDVSALFGTGVQVGKYQRFADFFDLSVVVRVSRTTDSPAAFPDSRHVVYRMDVSNFDVRSNLPMKSVTLQGDAMGSSEQVADELAVSRVISQLALVSAELLLGK